MAVNAVRVGEVGSNDFGKSSKLSTCGTRSTKQGKGVRAIWVVEKVENSKPRPRRNQCTL